MAMTDIGGSLKNSVDGYVAKGIDLQGVYTVVETIADRDNIPKANIVTGSLVYVSDDKKSYRWNGTKWEIEEGSSSVPYSAASTWVTVEDHKIDISEDAKSALSAVIDNNERWSNISDIVETSAGRWNTIADVPTDINTYAISEGVWTKIEIPETLSAGQGITIDNNVIDSFVDMELTEDNMLVFNNGKLTI